MNSANNTFAQIIWNHLRPGIFSTQANSTKLPGILVVFHQTARHMSHTALAQLMPLRTSTPTLRSYQADERKRSKRAKHSTNKLQRFRDGKRFEYAEIMKWQTASLVSGAWIFFACLDSCLRLNQICTTDSGGVPCFFRGCSIFLSTYQFRCLVEPKQKRFNERPRLIKPLSEIGALIYRFYSHEWSDKP